MPLGDFPNFIELLQCKYVMLHVNNICAIVDGYSIYVLNLILKHQKRIDVMLKPCNT